jgi:uncharacterized damage-inducible protein DinB
MIAQSPRSETRQTLITLLENSRSYTLAVAEAMPIKLDNYKPAADVWTFREQLHHIAYGIEWWNDNFVKGIKTAWAPPAASKSRKEVLGYLNQAYDSLKETLTSAPLNDDRVKGFHATIDHITHHRGQCIVYLRINSVAPPEYTY